MLIDCQELVWKVDRLKCRTNLEGTSRDFLFSRYFAFTMAIVLKVESEP